MGFAEILLIALSLAMDALAVSLAAGAAGRAHTARPVFRLSFHFGLFQFLMPLVGWLAGARLATLVARAAPWAAFLLLAAVGGRMLRSGLRPGAESRAGDPSRGWMLVMLSTAVSIDALAVGLGLGLLGVAIWYPAAVIGLVTGALSLAGLQVGDRLGARLGPRFGPRLEAAGGVVLLLIGLRILLAHLAG